MKKILLYSIFLILSSNGVFADPAPELKIQQLADHVYQHISYKMVEPWGLVDSNGLIVIEGKDAYIIDTPWSAADTEKLIAWIQQHGLNVKASVSTHFHSDRTAGIEFLNSKSIPTYASNLTNELLKNKNEPQATHSFAKNDFWLVKNVIEVYYPGPAHTRDNVAVWLPKQKILFGGCMVRANEAENMGNTADGDLKAWPESVKKLLAKFKAAKMVVPGHGQVGDKTLLEHTINMSETTTKK